MGNCKYYQTTATLTCGWDAVAGYRMVWTDPFMRVSVEAKPAWYWPSLLKQSDVKWLAHTYKLTGSVAGTLTLKIKCNHCLFCSSVAGPEYRHLCWFVQPTTKQFLSSSERRLCKTLLACSLDTPNRDGRPTLRYLLSLCRGGRPMNISPFFT